MNVRGTGTMVRNHKKAKGSLWTAVAAEKGG
jgi:hypothetical protein